MHLQTCYDGRYKRKICTWVLNGYFSATTLFLVGNAWHITRHFDLLYQHLHKTASKPDLYKRLCCGSLFLDKIQWIPVFVLGYPACHDSSTDRNRNPQPAERFRLPPITVQRWFFFPYTITLFQWMWTALVCEYDYLHCPGRNNFMLHYSDKSPTEPRYY